MCCLPFSLMHHMVWKAADNAESQSLCTAFPGNLSLSFSCFFFFSSIFILLLLPSYGSLCAEKIAQSKRLWHSVIQQCMDGASCLVPFRAVCRMMLPVPVPLSLPGFIQAQKIQCWVILVGTRIQVINIARPRKPRSPVLISVPWQWKDGRRMKR